MTVQGSGWADCFLNVPIISPASIEFDLTNYGGELAYNIYLWDSTTTNRIFQLYTRLGNTYLDYYPSESNYISDYIIPIGSHVKIVVNLNNVELYVDGVLKLTKSDYSIGDSFFFEVSTSTGRSTTYKNLKIEPL